MPALVWDELSDEQAEQIRDEYLAELPQRLQRFLDSIPDKIRNRADRTFESLDTVWEWWVTAHRAPEEIEDEDAFLDRELPLWARAAHGVGRTLGADNAIAASELAAYVATTIIDQHPDAEWAINHDREWANANQPLLQRPGQGVPFFPDNNIAVLCTKALTQPPRHGRDPRSPDALRTMIERNIGATQTPSVPVEQRSEPDSPVVVCRPSPAMPRRTYLVLLDEELARSHEQLLPALRRYMQDLSTVASIDDNDERSLIVTLRRFASHHDLQADVAAFVSNHARTSPA
jgi:hypothetical protein